MSEYQLLPPLRPEQMEALREDIRRRGVLVPVEVDADTGQILDGHHRLAIARELGIEPPVVRRRFDSEEERIEHVLKLNLLRRHMDPITRAETILKLAEVRGVQLGTSGGRPRKGENPATVSEFSEEVAEELGFSKRQVYRDLQLLRELEAHPDLKEEVRSGDKEAKRALRVARERAAAERRKAEAESIASVWSSGDVELRLGDMRTALDDLAGTVDAIVTDPPYGKDHLELYDVLSEVSARLLRPGGVVAVMVGQSHLPEYLARLGKHLTYRWTCAYIMPGPAARVFGRKVGTKWKPVLLFGGETFLTQDVFDSHTADKEHHAWGQSESGIQEIVQRLTEPGQLVVDPFLGGGTTAVVCHRLGRRFVGCDIDPEAVAAARRRLDES